MTLVRESFYRTDVNGKDLAGTNWINIHLLFEDFKLRQSFAHVSSNFDFLNYFLPLKSISYKTKSVTYTIVDFSLQALHSVILTPAAMTMEK